MTYANELVPYVRAHAIKRRCVLMAAFAVSWLFQIAMLAGTLGTAMQIVGAVFMVMWVANLVVLWRQGILPLVVAFWKTVFTGRA